MIGSVMSTSVQGLDQASRALERAARRAEGPGRSMDTAGRDVVDRVVSAAAYTANAATIRSADEMLGTLLDTVA